MTVITSWHCVQACLPSSWWVHAASELRSSHESRLTTRVSVDCGFIVYDLRMKCVCFFRRQRLCVRSSTLKVSPGRTAMSTPHVRTVASRYCCQTLQNGGSFEARVWMDTRRNQTALLIDVLSRRRCRGEGERTIFAVTTGMRRRCFTVRFSKSA